MVDRSSARLIAALIATGLVFASCSTRESGLPGSSTISTLSQAPASTNRTPQSQGLGNQQWTSCNNAGGTGAGGDDEGDNWGGHRDDGRHRGESDRHRGDRHGGDEGGDGGRHNGGSGSTCSGITLIAPLTTTVTTKPGAPGSSTQNVTFAFALASGTGCSPVNIGSTTATPSPSPSPEGDDETGHRHGDAVAQAASGFPLGATPVGITMEVTSFLTGLTVTDPCPVAAPFGLPSTATAGSVQPGYYIVLISKNALGNFGIAGALSLASVAGQQLTFAPQPDALIDLPQGFTYAFYLAQTSAAGLITLPNGINGGFH